MLITLSEKTAASVLEVLDQLAIPLKKTVFAKLKKNAAKHELEVSKAVRSL